MILIKDILARVSQKDIMCFYWGENLIDNKPIYRNPMRTDINGTCFFGWNNGNYRLVDMAKGTSFGPFDYVRWIYDCSLYEALQRINNDMLLNATNKLLSSSKVINHRKTKEKRATNFQIETRVWNESDRKYWSQFGISISTVDKIAKPVNSYFSDNGAFNFVKKYEYNEKDPCYVYQFKNSPRVKLYQPNSTSNKWKSNVSNSDIFGLEYLPHFGEVLFIASGAKDMMCLWEMGFHSIAPQSEAIDIPYNILTDLKCRFKKIIYLFDNDETGIKMSRQFSESNELDYIILPKIDNCKDVAELVKKTSIINTKSIIINECSKRQFVNSRTT